MDEQASLSMNEVRRSNEDSEEIPLRLFMHRKTMPPAPYACNNVTGDVFNANTNHTIGTTGNVINANPNHTMINVKLPNLKEALPPAPSV